MHFYRYGFIVVFAFMISACVRNDPVAGDTQDEHRDRIENFFRLKDSGFEKAHDIM